MIHKAKNYLTTAEAAQQLGLSIGTVQNLVTRGELDAVVTVGGHRRIYVQSFEQYKKAHGYREPLPGKKICILHHGDDLDPVLVQNQEVDGLQLMAHPLALLAMGPEVGALFIDARHAWLSAAPVALLDSLQKTYSVFVYNCEHLGENSHFSGLQGIHLLKENVSTHFISGYSLGRTLPHNSHTQH